MWHGIIEIKHYLIVVYHLFLYLFHCFLHSFIMQRFGIFLANLSLLYTVVIGDVVVRVLWLSIKIAAGLITVNKTSLICHMCLSRIIETVIIKYMQPNTIIDANFRPMFISGFKLFNTLLYDLINIFDIIHTHIHIFCMEMHYALKQAGGQPITF